MGQISTILSYAFLQSYEDRKWLGLWNYYKVCKYMVPDIPSCTSISFADYMKKAHIPNNNKEEAIPSLTQAL